MREFTCSKERFELGNPISQFFNTIRSHHFACDFRTELGPPPPPKKKKSLGLLGESCILGLDLVRVKIRVSIRGSVRVSLGVH